MFPGLPGNDTLGTKVPGEPRAAGDAAPWGALCPPGESRAGAPGEQHPHKPAHRQREATLFTARVIRLLCGSRDEPGAITALVGKANVCCWCKLEEKRSGSFTLLVCPGVGGLVAEGSSACSWATLQGRQEERCGLCLSDGSTRLQKIGAAPGNGGFNSRLATCVFDHQHLQLAHGSHLAAPAFVLRTLKQKGEMLFPCLHHPPHGRERRCRPCRTLANTVPGGEVGRTWSAGQPPPRDADVVTFRLKGAVSQ